VTSGISATNLPQRNDRGNTSALVRVGYVIRKQINGFGSVQTTQRTNRSASSIHIREHAMTEELHKPTDVTSALSIIDVKYSPDLFLAAHSHFRLRIARMHSSIIPGSAITTFPFSPKNPGAASQTLLAAFPHAIH